MSTYARKSDANKAGKKKFGEGNFEVRAEGDRFLVLEIVKDPSAAISVPGYEDAKANAALQAIKSGNGTRAGIIAATSWSVPTVRNFICALRGIEKLPIKTTRTPAGPVWSIQPAAQEAAQAQA
jgi:hypothetical protein